MINETLVARARRWGLVAILFAPVVSAAVISGSNGQTIEGEVTGIVVFKQESAEEVRYVLLSGTAIAAIDQGGARIRAAAPQREPVSGPSAHVVLTVAGTEPSAALTPAAELELLRSQASSDFKIQMDGLMKFHVRTGQRFDVNRMDEARATSVTGEIYGVLEAQGTSLARELRVSTAAGEVAVPFP